MTPGLARGPPFPRKATKGAIVAVASIEKPTVPKVVGICEIDVASLQQVQGAKGHAVSSEHWDGDEIWAWSTSGKPGDPSPDHIEGWGYADSRSDLEQATKHLNVEDKEDEAEEGGVRLSSDEPSRPQHRDLYSESTEPFEHVEEDKEMSIQGRVPSGCQ